MWVERNWEKGHLRKILLKLLRLQESHVKSAVNIFSPTPVEEGQEKGIPL